LNERLPQELHRSQRYKHPLAVIIADIDHFKQVNDTHGHQVGDDVLKEIARIIMAQVRGNVDWVVRYGGEEFLVILPETPCEGAHSVAERIRRAVGAHAWSYGDLSLKITASFGGACACFETQPQMGITVDRLINQADRQLYLSKKEGRDRVNVMALESAPSETFQP